MSNSWIKPTLVELGLSPDIVDEVDENVTYMGFVSPGASGTDDAKFMIKKVEKVGTETTILYAEGSAMYNKVWDDRATYNYYFRK